MASSDGLIAHDYERHIDSVSGNLSARRENLARTSSVFFSSIKRKRRVFRSRVYFFLITGSATNAEERAFRLALISITFLSVLSAMMETVFFNVAWVEDLKDALVRTIAPVSALIFTSTYTLRIWSCPTDLRLPKNAAGEVHPVFGRLKWMLRPVSLVELATLCPWYLSVVFPSGTLFCCPDTRGDPSTAASILRMFRILRVLCLYRFSPSLRLLARVIVLKSSELFMAFILDGILVITMAAVIFFAEKNHNAQISSMYTSLYFTTISLSTVGYGDIVPRTNLGRFVISLASTLGIGIFTLPAAILSSGILELKDERSKRKTAMLELLAEKHRIATLRTALARLRPRRPAAVAWQSLTAATDWSPSETALAGLPAAHGARTMLSGALAVVEPGDGQPARPPGPPRVAAAQGSAAGAATASAPDEEAVWRVAGAVLSLLDADNGGRLSADESRALRGLLRARDDRLRGAAIVARRAIMAAALQHFRDVAADVLSGQAAL